MGKIIHITESQYKRIFLSEQSDGGWKTYNEYSKEEQKKIDDEILRQKMIEFDKSLPKDSIAHKICSKYQDHKKYGSGEFNYCMQSNAFKVIREIEKMKMDWIPGHSPWNKKSKSGCYYAGLKPYSPIKVNHFDWEGGKSIGKSAYYRLGGYEKSLVDKMGIPGYVYSGLQPFVYDNKLWNSYMSSDAEPGRNRFRSMPETNGDGWYNFMMSYYGSDSLNVIKSNLKKYAAMMDAPLNCQPGDRNTIVFDATPKGNDMITKAFTGIGEFVADCATDYHCILDVASIAALAIPGAGIFIAAGLDGINAASYFYEAATDDSMSKKEKYLHVMAGSMTLVGVVPGVSQGLKIAKAGSNSAQKAIKDYSILQAELTLKNASKKEYQNAFKNTIGKLTDPKDVEVVTKFFTHMEKSGPLIKKKLDEIISFSKSKRVELETFLKQKPANFDKFLKQANGDLMEAFKLFRKTTAGREALKQAGLFAAVSAILPPIAVKTQKAYNELVKDGTIYDITGGKWGGIKDKVEVNGYNWKDVKEHFKSNSKTHDNDLLARAWMLGWRPDKPLSGEKTGFDWLIKNSKYQTKGFKDWIKEKSNDVLGSAETEIMTSEKDGDGNYKTITVGEFNDESASQVTDDDWDY